MIPPIPKLEEYGLSPETGFMPEEHPLERLEDTYYAPWERIMDRFNGLLLAGRLREAVLKVLSDERNVLISQLPTLSTLYLETPSEKRRAYVILSFLAHGYIWGGASPIDVCLPHQSKF
jgi:indoleamine 2,3-dioxygenase